MAHICQGCGGVLGRDCFNEQECIQITNSINSFDEQWYIDALNNLRNELSVAIEKNNELSERLKKYEPQIVIVKDSGWKYFDKNPY